MSLPEVQCQSLVNPGGLSTAHHVCWTFNSGLVSVGGNCVVALRRCDAVFRCSTTGVM